MEEIVLTKRVRVNNATRFEFYVPSLRLYINVSAESEEEARKKAAEMLSMLRSSVKGD